LVASSWCSPLRVFFHSSSCVRSFPSFSVTHSSARRCVPADLQCQPRSLLSFSHLLSVHRRPAVRIMVPEVQFTKPAVLY
jgi:hypothetical protein